MSVEVSIVDGPLPQMREASDAIDGAGAVVCFEGVVRRMETGRELAALLYEEYPPMTERELQRLARSVLDGYGLLAIAVEHSRGEVPVGACSFRLRIAAAHRKEALTAMDGFIDAMKREVPLWKTPVWNKVWNKEAAGV